MSLEGARFSMRLWKHPLLVLAKDGMKSELISTRCLDISAKVCPEAAITAKNSEYYGSRHRNLQWIGKVDVCRIAWLVVLHSRDIIIN